MKTTEKMRVWIVKGWAINQESCQIVFCDLNLAEDFENYLSKEGFITDILCTTVVDSFEVAKNRFDMQTNNVLGNLK